MLGRPFAPPNQCDGDTTHGWQAVISGVVASYGDNYIDGNGGNTGVLAIIGKQ
jgi:hypothetical protein